MWLHGNTAVLSGSVAFYALLSLAPVLLVAVRLAGVATSEDAARRALLQTLPRWIGAEGTHTVATLLAAAGSAGAQVPWALQFLVLGYASSSLFVVLQRSLHVLWDEPMHSPDAIHHKVLSALRQRAVSFALVLLVGVILVALVLWNAALAYVAHRLGAHSALAGGASAGFSFLLTVLLFTGIFKVLPEARVATRDAALGGAVTAALFSVGAALVGLYVGLQANRSFFGAASSVVMLVLWTNYSAQVFFLGAAFTGAHARMRGEGLYTPR